VLTLGALAEPSAGGAVAASTRAFLTPRQLAEARAQTDRPWATRPMTGRGTEAAPPLTQEQEETARRPASAASLPSGGNPSGGASEPNGAGSGAGRTPTVARVRPLRFSGVDGQSPGGQTLAAGSGGSAGKPDGEAGDSAGIVGGNPASAAPAPWQSAGWPAAQAEADQALRSGQVPDAYRAIVQAYFQR
jgi:hypothetical protein